MATEIYNQLKYERSGSIKYSIKTISLFRHKQPLNSTSIRVSVNYVNNNEIMLINMYVRINIE